MEQELDLKGLKCPLPILRTKKALAYLNSGDILTVFATDASAPGDFAAFCRQTGHILLNNETLPDEVFKIVLQHK